MKILFLYNNNESLMLIAIVLRTEFSRYLRYQRSVASRHGKLVDPKAHKYVEYRQRETPEINRLSTNDAAMKILETSAKISYTFICISRT